ncbi:uncharacterized protein LOC123320976 [Coccinella septempunctata]|uniref:uncharacterized protein LOC123320976 n=1 Tax=Coccinella septempunctata TaxID=41139 RepID=UPI001D073AB7|nr:uncharacterized protein LOC123320976 [Coccinella septempunctata]
MSFYEDIHRLYGAGTANCLKKWAISTRRIAMCTTRRNFLLTCRSRGLRPRHIVQNIKCITNLLGSGTSEDRTVADFSNKVSSKLLNLEITITIKRLRFLHAELNTVMAQAKELVPPGVFNKFTSTQNRYYNRIFVTNANSLNVKLNNLTTHKVKSLKVQPGWFRNLTDYVFPPDICSMLSLGPKFAHVAVPGRNISIKTILSDVEYIIKIAPEECQDILRAKCTNSITNHFHSSLVGRSYELGLFYRTRTFIKQHHDLLITSADKGNVTVAIKKEAYKEKLLHLLDDPITYKVLQSDPTSKYQTSNNKLVKELKTSGFIDPVVARKLTTYKGIAPRIYGLPKIHKDDIPLRPIVSTINSPTSALDEYVTGILSTAFRDYHTFAVSDSFQFSILVNNCSIPQNYVVCSLDAVSLFTNISWEITCSIIMDEWDMISPHTTMPQAKFIQVLKFLSDTNYFLYDGIYYSQLFGIPMGTRRGPVLAAVVMSTLLRKKVPALSFQPHFLCQYVDDLIMAIPEDGVEEVLSSFNCFDEHIKFTVELENERSVPFLDTLVTRDENNVIKLDWYLKPTSSGRYIHKASNHDWGMKVNTIVGMRDRITHPEFTHAAHRRLSNILTDNGYQRSLVNKLIFSSPASTPTPAQQPQVEVQTNEQIAHPPQRGDLADEGGSEAVTVSMEPQIRYTSLPFVPKLTHKLSNILSIIPDIKIAKYNVFPNRLLFSNLKDSIPLMYKSNVVYAIDCGDCNGTYVGQTTQILKNRIALHKSDTRLHPERCALALHANRLNHCFNFDDARVLTTVTNYEKKIFIEMCHINNCDNSVNKKTDVGNLSRIYSYLLELDRVSSSPDLVRTEDVPVT